MCREAKARLFHQSHAENSPQGFWVIIEFRESTFLFDKDNDIYQPLAEYCQHYFSLKSPGVSFIMTFSRSSDSTWDILSDCLCTDTYLPPCKNTASDLGLVRIEVSCGLTCDWILKLYGRSRRAHGLSENSPATASWKIGDSVNKILKPFSYGIIWFSKHSYAQNVLIKTCALPYNLFKVLLLAVFKLEMEWLLNFEWCTWLTAYTI